MPFQRFLPSLLGMLAINALLWLGLRVFFPWFATWERLAAVSAGVVIGSLLWPLRAKSEKQSNGS